MMNTFARWPLAPRSHVAWMLVPLMLMLLGAAPPAFAGTNLHTNGFGEVPAQKIVFDNLDVSEAELISPKSSITRKTVSHPDETRTRCSIVLHVNDGNATTVDSPFSLRFNDAGYDASGERVDLLLTCKKLTLQAYDNKAISAGDYIIVRNTATLNSLGLFAWCVEGQVNRLGIQQDYEVKVLKRGTDTTCPYPLLMYTCDLDTRDLTGDTPSYEGAFAESLKLLSGYESDSYVTPNTTVVASESNTRFRGSAADDNSDTSAVVFSLSKGGGEFRWSGTKCGTQVFRAFTRTITASAGKGGTISPGGNASVLWRNDAGYAITAEPHYAIDDVKVDGKSVGAVEGYDFINVTSDHAIEASFKPLVYTLRFDLNGQEGTPPESQDLNFEQTATEPADPSAPHHTFGGWFKDPEGTTPWDFASDTMPDEDVTLYAKWTPESYLVAFDANGGEGQMDEQEFAYTVTQALNENEFKRPGFTYLGWNTAADGSGTSYQDGQKVCDLVNADGSEVTLYAQWKQITHTVTFVDPDGNIIDTQEVPDGGDATDPGAPDREGETFTGWDKEFTNVQDDLTVTAQYEPANNEQPAPEEQKTEEPTTPDSTPERASASQPAASSGGYAKTGNPLATYGWAIPLIGLAAAGAIGAGIFLRRKSRIQR